MPPFCLFIVSKFRLILGFLEFQRNFLSRECRDLKKLEGLHLSLDGTTVRFIVANNFSISHWWFRARMVSRGEGGLGLFHNLMIVSFAGSRSCVATNRMLSGSSWIVRCKIASSGLGAM